MVPALPRAGPRWRVRRRLPRASGCDGHRGSAHSGAQPWQSPYVERVIGSIRREWLDNVVVLHERHLRRLLSAYFDHYHRWRCHRGLALDCPEPRPIQSPEQGAVVEVTEGGGLYRHYERWAA